MSHENSEQAIYRALHRSNAPIVITIGAQGGWRQALVHDLGELATNRALVVVPHGLARLTLDLIRRRRITFSRPLPVSAVSRELIRLGWTPVSAYRLWPSPSQPRVALPRMNSRAAAWLQWSGVLGGGRLLWVRRLLRSRFLTPLVLKTARATAIVVERPTDSLQT